MEPKNIANLEKIARANYAKTTTSKNEDANKNKD